MSAIGVHAEMLSTRRRQRISSAISAPRREIWLGSHCAVTVSRIFTHPNSESQANIPHLQTCQCRSKAIHYFR